MQGSLHNCYLSFVWVGFFSSLFPQVRGRGAILLPPRPGRVHPGYISGHTFSSHVTVSSSTDIRPWIPFGAWYIGHSRITWSAVCSSAPHSQLALEAKPHLCINERNLPTPVRRRFSLTQAGLGRSIPAGGKRTLQMKSWSLDEFASQSLLQT